MDGFHYDDAVLKGKGLSSRKGAPETFDFDGYATLLARLRAADRDVAIPVFDRSIELSRAAAAIVRQDVKFVLTEGNYLLLDEEPWSRLGPLFDFTIFLDVPREELERRLIQRWLDHGRTPEDGRNWVNTNDLPNVDRVLARRRKADLVVSAAAAAD
jgi:pantothenate kinase